MLKMALVSLLLAGAGLAQQAVENPPQSVESALRARVHKFYQAHVDRKYRIADEVVAEESKDAFFEAPKPAYRSFEIRKVEYSDDFTRASVTVHVETTMMMPGVGPLPSVRDLVTDWKTIDGQWFMVIPTAQKTPFGTMRKGEGSPGAPGPLPPGITGVQDFSSPLKTNEKEVRLSAATPSRDVTVTNAMGGVVSIVVDAPPIKGLSATLDRETLKMNESARLTIRWEGEGKLPEAPVNVLIRLKQLPFSLPVKVVFSDAK